MLHINIQKVMTNEFEILTDSNLRFLDACFSMRKWKSYFFREK